MSPSTPTTSTEQNVRWHPMPSVSDIQQAVVDRVLAGATEAIARRGRFDIVLAGGSTPKVVYERLRNAAADWSRWQVFFGDERCAPVDDPARNSHMAAAAWLAHVPIPASQVHLIEAERGATEAAARYAELLAPIDSFDLVLLGLGEDGHTGSLFPGQDPGAQADAPAALAVFDAPKPPPERVSLSASRFGRSREVIFIVTGEGKREALRRWRAGAAIPARSVAPKAGVDVFVEAALLTD